MAYLRGDELRAPTLPLVGNITALMADSGISRLFDILLPRQFIRQSPRVRKEVRRGKSGQRRAWQSLTATRSNPRESATETKLP